MKFLLKDQSQMTKYNCDVSKKYVQTPFCFNPFTSPLIVKVYRSDEVHQASSHVLPASM